MKRILFVDDEQGILDGIRRMLSPDNFRWEMDFVTSGQEALRACEEQPYDVVVSDVRMPGMDGATLLHHIRSRYPETARLILSAYSESENVTSAISVAYRVLPKPCSAATLRIVFERIFKLQDLLNMPGLRSIIGAIGELPSLSSTYISLTEALDDPDATITRIAKIIEIDPAMSAKLLQLINSGFFGLSQEITVLRNAVAYLGTDTIRNLILVTDAFRMLARSRLTEDLCHQIRARSHRVSAIVATLPVNAKDRDAIVVASLLQDIGELVLASRMPVQFSASRKIAQASGCDTFEAEEKIFGISHAEVGAYLLGLWGINAVIVDAITHHHRPTRIRHDGMDCAAALYIATLLTHVCTNRIAGKPELTEYHQDCLRDLGFLDRWPEFLREASAALNPAIAA